jgi:hypothetical protein
VIRILAVALIATVSAGPAAAPAATARESKVVFKGTGSYRLHYVLKSGASFVLSASFKFRTVFPTAFFTRGTAGGENLSSVRASSYGGAWQASVTSPTHNTICAGTGTFGNPAAGTPPARLVYTWSSHTRKVDVHTSALPNGELPTITNHANDCSGQLPAHSNTRKAARDFWADWVESFSKIPAPSSKFKVPDRILSDRTATETTSAIGSTLPGSCRTGSYRTCTQSFKWTGSVSFSRIG